MHIGSPEDGIISINGEQRQTLESGVAEHLVHGTWMHCDQLEDVWDQSGSILGRILVEADKERGEGGGHCLHHD